MLQATKGLTIALSSVILLATLDVNAARFYKSVDENGKVIFSDRPASADAEQIDVKVFTPDTPAPVAPTTQKPAKENQKETKGSEEEKNAKEDLVTLQATRDENCKKAKERLHKLQTISRLYTEDKQGNRTYISDEDRVKQLADARTSITEWCK